MPYLASLMALPLVTLAKNCFQGPYHGQGLGVFGWDLKSKSAPQGKSSLVVPRISVFGHGKAANPQNDCHIVIFCPNYFFLGMGK